MLLWPAPGSAQSKTQAAREATENGRRAYNLSRWDEAVAQFEKAYQLSGDPALLFNLAQAHRQAGHANEAVRFYKTYLREQPNSPNREIAEKQLSELHAADTPSPAAPATAPPPPAAPARASSPETAPSVMGAPAASADVPVVVAPPAPAPAAQSTPLPGWMPLTGLVATAGLTAAAIVSGVSASSRYDELASTCGGTTAGCAAGDIDGVRSRDKLTTALWIATGVVAAGTGVAIVVNTR